MVPRRDFLTILCGAGAAVPLGAFSMEESRQAAAKIDRIVNEELDPGETLPLTEDEINSYLHYEYADELPSGVRGLRVHFEKNIGVVTGFADFSKLAEGGEGPGRFVLMLLRGEREFKARCRYVSARGQATVDVESFLVDGREMKGPLLDWMINRYVAPRMDGIGLGEPVPLGHNLEQVRLDPGQAVFIAKNQIADD